MLALSIINNYISNLYAIFCVSNFTLSAFSVFLVDDEDMRMMTMIMMVMMTVITKVTFSLAYTSLPTSYLYVFLLTTPKSVGQGLMYSFYR